ncbi:MAG TPA: gas vesicle protein GvpJ [Candidatus Angelobacter sp.]
MHPLVANKDDLISVLDRVLDKGIVLDASARLSVQGSDLKSTDCRVAVSQSAVYVGYGTRGSWREDMEVEDLFPFWRRELWSK